MHFKLGIFKLGINESLQEKICFLHMRQQMRRTTAQLISAFVLAIYIKSILPFLSKAKFKASVHLLCVAVQPGLCLTWSETPKTGFLETQLK